jgi:hypothetical protein
MKEFNKVSLESPQTKPSQAGQPPLTEYEEKLKEQVLLLSAQNDKNYKMFKEREANMTNEEKTIALLAVLLQIKAILDKAFEFYQERMKNSN